MALVPDKIIPVSKGRRSAYLPKCWQWNTETDECIEVVGIPAYDVWTNLDRVVERTYLEGYYVSTVFLSLNHGFDGRVLLFETMVFSVKPRRKGEVADGIERLTQRYETAVQARQGHLEVCQEVKKTMGRFFGKEYKYELHLSPEQKGRAERFLRCKFRNFTRVSNGDYKVVLSKTGVEFFIQRMKDCLSCVGYYDTGAYRRLLNRFESALKRGPVTVKEG